MISDVLHLVDALALLIYSVARQVRSNIRPFGHIPQQIIPGFGDFQNRTRFGVALTEKKKIEGIFFRQDHEVGLRVSVGTSFGGTAEFTVADELPDFSRMQLSDLVFLHDSDSPVLR